MRSRNLKTNASKLGQLKNLLLADELEQLKKLESKLETLAFESYDEETITRKVLPLFDEMLLQRLEQKESKTIALLSQYLAQIIVQSSKHNLPALSHSLQSVISPAISKEIEQNKDKMIDTLYPIIGGMISKYVTHAIKEMMKNINVKIEDGLSFRRYKRKLKSKVTGVSESELLLEESTEAEISSLFVIHKESGMLIAEAHLENQEIDDPHMVASMASAIKDFINDWTKSHEESSLSEVQIVSYGNNTLYIESAGSVYIIAFLASEPDHEQRSSINDFFGKLIKKHGLFFQQFDGDDSSHEIEEISQKMYGFLEKHTQLLSPHKHKHSSGNKHTNPLKYLWMLLVAALIWYLFLTVRQYYTSYQLQEKIFIQTQQRVEVQYTGSDIRLIGSLSSMSDFYTIKKIIADETGGGFINALHIPIEEIDNRFSTQHSNILRLESNLSEQTDLLGRLKQRSLGDNSTITTLKNTTLKHSDSIATLIARLQEQQQTTAALKATLSQQNTRLRNTQASSIAALQNKIDLLTDKFNKIDSKYCTLQEKVAKIDQIARTRQYIITKLSKTFGQSDAFHSEDGSLDFKNGKLFGIGKVLARQSALKKLEADFNKYVEILMSDPKISPFLQAIVIEGHTDSTGGDAYNKELSLQRAERIRAYLLGLDISKKLQLGTLLKAKGMANQNPIIINGIEDKETSRRIKIKFAMSTESILKSIKKETDD